jgi:IS30 family transposase
MNLPLTPREAREARRCAKLYVEERLSCREIGRRLTMHPATVRKHLDRAGIPREKGRHLRTDAALLAAIAALTDAGLTQREIGARVGRCHVTVGRWQPRLRVNAPRCDSDAPSGENDQERLSAVSGARMGVLER